MLGPLPLILATENSTRLQDRPAGDIVWLLHSAESRKLWGWFVFGALFRNVAHVPSVLLFTNISGKTYYHPSQENII